MVEFKNLEEVAKYFEVDIDEVQREYSESLGWHYMRLGDVMLQQPVEGEYGELVLVDEDSDTDTKEYIMKYELNIYDWFILKGGKVIKVEVNDVYNEKLDNIVAVRGVDENGDDVWENVEYICFKDQIVSEGIVYFMDKE